MQFWGYAPSDLIDSAINEDLSNVLVGLSDVLIDNQLLNVQIFFRLDLSKQKTYRF